MKKNFTATEIKKEKWNRRYTNNFVSPRQRNTNIFANIFEDAKSYFLSSEIIIKLLAIHQKLQQLTQPTHVDITKAAKRACLLRYASAVLWSALAQLLLAIQFQILVHADFQLDSWFFNSFNGIKNTFNVPQRAFTSLILVGYGFLVSEFYVRPIPICFTRSDYALHEGFRKLLLFGAQLVFVYWTLHTFKAYFPEKDSDSNSLYGYTLFTTFNAVLYNFWKLYLFQPLKMNFDLVDTPAYEQLYCMVRPKLWLMLKRISSPLWQFTLIYFLITSAANWIENSLNIDGGTLSFPITFINIRIVLQLWLVLAQSLHTIHTLDCLIRFKFSQQMTFALKNKTGKALLLEALQTQDSNPWIFELSARDFLALSNDNARYRDLYVMTYKDTPYLWKDISEISLEIIRQFTRDVSKAFESPDKLMKTELIERALHQNNAQHIFKRIYDQEGFIVSLSTAPTLCSCPLGPIRPAKPVLAGWLSYILWFHMELFYKLLTYSKVMHLWHYLFCPTFGVEIRYQLQGSEPIEAIIRAVLNICLSAYKDNELLFIKSTIPTYVKTLMDLIEVLEVIPFNRYQLYGLDEQSFGKLKSLKAHAKQSLFCLLQCYEDKLMIFVQDDIDDVDRFIKLYKWPLKVH